MFYELSVVKLELIDWTLVHYLSDLNHHKLHEFLKLVLEAVRLVKQNNKKEFLQAERIVKYIKNGFKNN